MFAVADWPAGGQQMQRRTSINILLFVMCRGIASFKILKLILPYITNG